MLYTCALDKATVPPIITGELEHKLGKKQESLMILEKQVQELTQELKSSTQQACQLEKQLDSTQVKLEKNEVILYCCLKKLML